MEQNKSFHAVKIKDDKCKGCINCMKRCPTEAIRVRDGKARINYNRCVSCGECIRVCPNKAKYAVYDSLDEINNYKYKVALPAPSLIGQFATIDKPSLMLNSLYNLGFDDVFEVGRGADIVSKLTRDKLEDSSRAKPLISTACPVCVELILLRFHSLKDNLTDIMPPLEISAKLARAEARAKTGLADKDIGVFFISPCPAKVASVKNKLYTDDININGVLAAREVLLKLANVKLSDIEIKKDVTASRNGIGWATTGGEVNNLSRSLRNLACDGIENVISVLKELEDGKLSNIDYVELNACPSGCVGGVLNVENPFVARSRMRTLSKTVLSTQDNLVDTINRQESFYKVGKEWDTSDVFRLDEDFSVALEKMGKADEIEAMLPGLDCGVCGAPSCHAFAEDVVEGIISIDKCVRGIK